MRLQNLTTRIFAKGSEAIAVFTNLQNLLKNMKYKVKSHLGHSTTTFPKTYFFIPRGLINYFKSLSVKGYAQSFQTPDPSSICHSHLFDETTYELSTHNLHENFPRTLSS